MTFDDLLIKALGLSSDNFKIFRYTLDAFYVAVPSVIFLRRQPSELVTPELIFAVLAFIFGILATSIATGDLSSNLDFLFVTLRYLPIGAALATFNRPQVRTLVSNAFNIIFLLQVVASVPQMLGVEPIVDLLLPQQIEGLDARIAKDVSAWDGSIFGTFPESVSLAFFLLFFILFLRYETASKISYFKIAAAILMIYFTNSFFVLISAFFVIFYWIVGIRILLNSGTLFLIFSVTLSNFISINGMSYNEYLIISETGRLGIINYTLPSFINGASLLEIIFGIGRNVETIRDVVFAATYVPDSLRYAQSTAALEDVFYIALFMYFGMYGFIAYLSVYIVPLIRIYRRYANTAGPVLISSAVLALGMTVNQVFSFQIVSAAYWVLMALAVAQPSSGVRNVG